MQTIQQRNVTFVRIMLEWEWDELFDSSVEKSTENIFQYGSNVDQSVRWKSNTEWNSHHTQIHTHTHSRHIKKFKQRDRNAEKKVFSIQRGGEIANDIRIFQLNTAIVLFFVVFLGLLFGDILFGRSVFFSLFYSRCSTDLVVIQIKYCTIFPINTP